jgi:hypothetical protein
LITAPSKGLVGISTKMLQVLPANQPPLPTHVGKVANIRLFKKKRFQDTKIKMYNHIIEPKKKKKSILSLIELLH